MSKRNTDIDNMDDTTKGAYAGRSFGLALGAAVDSVFVGARNILKEASDTVLGTTGQLAGTLVGGGVGATKSLFSSTGGKTVEQINAQTALDVARIKAKGQRKLAIKSAKAVIAAEKKAAKAITLAKQAQSEAAAAEALTDED